MGRLGVFLDSLDGEPLGMATSFKDWEVTIPLNDSRTGKVTLPIKDPIAAHVRPMQTRVRMYWDSLLVLHGLVTTPNWNVGDGEVEVIVHDPTVFLKHHYLRFGDLTVDTGYNIDDNGLWYVLADARASEYQLGEGVRDLPIAEGCYMRDVAIDEGTKHRKAERGSQVWDTLTNSVELFQGPDMDFRPVDAVTGMQQGEPVGGFDSTPWDPMFMCQMDLYEQAMTDRSATFDHSAVLLQYGFGRDNLSDMTYSPDGESVKNAPVFVKPGGETDATDATSRGDYIDLTSQATYGIMESWESAGQNDDLELLEDKAHLYAALYSDPLDAMTVTLKPNAPRFGRQFWHGDVIRVQAKRGYMPVVDFRSRVMSVTLSQVEGTLVGTQSLDLSPFKALELLEDVPGVGGGGGIGTT
jgi:hypothetical protein